MRPMGATIYTDGRLRHSGTAEAGEESAFLCSISVVN